MQIVKVFLNLHNFDYSRNVLDVLKNRGYEVMCLPWG